MALMNFSLATLAEMDAGRIAARIQKEIDLCVADCRDRPTELKPRKVSMHFEITPVDADGTGDLENVAVRLRFKNNMPDRLTRPYSMGVKKKGTLYFNDMAPDNVHQKTIDEAAPDEA